MMHVSPKHPNKNQEQKIEETPIFFIDIQGSPTAELKKYVARYPVEIKKDLKTKEFFKEKAVKEKLSEVMKGEAIIIITNVSHFIIKIEKRFKRLKGKKKEYQKDVPLDFSITKKNAHNKEEKRTPRYVLVGFSGCDDIKLNMSDKQNSTKLNSTLLTMGKGDYLLLPARLLQLKVDSFKDIGHTVRYNVIRVPRKLIEGKEKPHSDFVSKL